MRQPGSSALASDGPGLTERGPQDDLALTSEAANNRLGRFQVMAEGAEETRAESGADLEHLR